MSHIVYDRHINGTKGKVTLSVERTPFMTAPVTKTARSAGIKIPHIVNRSLQAPHERRTIPSPGPTFSLVHTAARRKSVPGNIDAKSIPFLAIIPDTSNASEKKGSILRVLRSDRPFAARIISITPPRKLSTVSLTRSFPSDPNSFCLVTFLPILHHLLPRTGCRYRTCRSCSVLCRAPAADIDHAASALSFAAHRLQM